MGRVYFFSNLYVVVLFLERLFRVWIKGIRFFIVVVIDVLKFNYLVLYVCFRIVIYFFFFDELSIRFL